MYSLNLQSWLLNIWWQYSSFQVVFGLSFKATSLAKMHYLNVEYCNLNQSDGECSVRDSSAKKRDLLIYVEANVGADRTSFAPVSSPVFPILYRSVARAMHVSTGGYRGIKIVESQSILGGNLSLTFQRIYARLCTNMTSNFGILFEYVLKVSLT